MFKSCAVSLFATSPPQSPPQFCENIREFFAECTEGLFDGFRIDTDDRIWTSARDGVHCYDKAGQMIGKIKIPEIVSNICFGGSKLNRLFITGTTSLYSIYLAINGKAF